MANGIVIDKKISSPLNNLEKLVVMYKNELESFISQFDFLGSVDYYTYEEFDSIEHVYSIENLQNKPLSEFLPILDLIENHMEEFCKNNGIYEFYLDVRTFIE